MAGRPSRSALALRSPPLVVKLPTSGCLTRLIRRSINLPVERCVLILDIVALMRCFWVVQMLLKSWIAVITRLSHRSRERFRGSVHSFRVSQWLAINVVGGFAMRAQAGAPVSSFLGALGQQRALSGAKSPTWQGGLLALASQWLSSGTKASQEKRV